MSDPITLADLRRSEYRTWAGLLVMAAALGVGAWYAVPRVLGPVVPVPLPVPVVATDIDGPTQVDIGQIILLKSKLEGTEPTWLVEQGVQGIEIEAGKALILPSNEARTITAHALCIANGKIKRATHRVVVGSGPRPPPIVEPDKPPVVVPPVVPNVKATAATYVYEQRDGPVPVGVMTGLNRLNREKKIVATLFDDDTTNGNKAIPAQYKAAVEAARKEGLPVLVVTNGDTVIKTVKAPTTEAQIMGAIE